MKLPDNETSPAVFELMVELRKFTRTTLILQHVIAENIGLRVTDAECIDFLQEMGPSTAGDLAKATRLTTGAITNVIDRLEKAGFVKRSADPHDRRKVIVSFLPKKHMKAKANYKNLANGVQNLFSRYDEKQLKFLIHHTQQLAEIFQRLACEIETS